MRLLQMDFQPLFMSGLCLRKVDRSLWSAIQKKVVPLKRPSCSICGFVAETKRGIIHADEVWSFANPPTVVLVDIRPLCVNCHDCKDYCDFLRRVSQTKASTSRSISIIEHYCAINSCNYFDFDEDFKLAMARKNFIEATYGWNFKKHVIVEYGKWDRALDKPRLSDPEKVLIRSLYKDRDGEILIRGKSLGSFAAAVRFLQSIQLADRAAIIQEMQDFVREEYDDDEVLSEADDGIQFL